MSLCSGSPGAAPLFVFDDRTRALRPLHWAGKVVRVHYTMAECGELLAAPELTDPPQRHRGCLVSGHGRERRDRRGRFCRG